MEVHTIIEVKCLGRYAARRLFRDKVGEDAINSHPLIPRHADDVADECDGLPLALITIGSAMAGKKTVQVWRNAVNHLRRSKPSKAPGMEPSKVPGTFDPLSRLKFSYDHLSPKQQQCFLHCALWPEDYEVPKEELIECWMGHDLLEDNVDDIQDVYDQGYDMIDALHKACLLQCVEPDPLGLKLSNRECVKLHDVIRDMALWIASDCGNNEKKWIVLQHTSDLPHDTRVWCEVHKMSAMGDRTRGGRIKGFPSGIQSCPKLSTLILQYNPLLSSGRMVAIKHFTQLKYLDLHGCRSLKEFPIEICSLIKLEYLNISNTCISSLPNELKNLRNLKYLLAAGRNGISHLPRDLMSNLVSLFHLDVFTWTSISQSSIIDDLSCVNGRLGALGISVSTVSDIEKLVRLDNMSIRRLLIQRMDGITSLRLLSGDVLGRKHMHSNLKQLQISDCVPTWEELVVDEEHHLSNLDLLQLDRLTGLKEFIWKGVRPQNVLPNLRTVIIRECHRLKHITWIANLPCLEHMHLEDCKNMKHLIWVDAVGRAESHVLGFPSLRSLNMSELPNLESICDSVLACPSLEHLFVECCARLTKLPFQSPRSLRNIKVIICQAGWWNDLEMDDMRNFLQPFCLRMA